jgi:hypothetical protein
MRLGSLPQHRWGFSLPREKNVGRVIRRPTQVFPRPFAHVGDALLGMRFGRGRWLRRDLKHGEVLENTGSTVEA